jgi:16S rRNA (adenine1518-N6/adenine1519-N6)-dimethyltransferase
LPRSRKILSLLDLNDKKVLEKTKKICDLHNIKPARSRGQNFLVRDDIYNDILDAADLNKDDVVLEVGPGLGFLTEKLSKRVKKVITVELDDKLAQVLKSNFSLWDVGNVEIKNMNVLDFDPEKIDGEYKIVANLPYNITSVFLRKFLSTVKNKPKEIVLMLQKEVVQRIAADVPKMSILGISVQYYADTEIIRYVPREFFWPAPKVESGIIKIVTKDIDIDEKYEKDFFRFVKMGFVSKRKMLKNNLAAGLHINAPEAIELIKKAGFNEKVRAQELGVEDWKKLIFVILGA